MSNTYRKTDTIAELSEGIILSQYADKLRFREGYQTESELEQQLLLDLEAQGYTRVSLHTSSELYANLKVQLEKLNNVVFSDDEWQRFLNEYLDVANEGVIEKTNKIQEDYIKDFIFDTGHIKNIYLIDKVNIHNNSVQVTSQVVQVGTHHNRYDVTILINGLPLVQVELKKRGVSLIEAFNQVHRYGGESYNAENSLFKYVQLFVISNGTTTRYFANTTTRDKNNYEFTCQWADVRNKTIDDLENFTATFFNKRTLLELLTKYCILTVDNMLLVMRPYQIAATEKIIMKIENSFKNNIWSSEKSGGYIWHTTGSGKTLTSFKTARLATQLECIEKVFFVVDRKDLDYQTMKEYQKFQANSVNGSNNTKELKQNIEQEDGKIIVTTIQKLNEFMKSNANHPVFNRHCVLIFDECHRSQFGEAQTNIQRLFKRYYQFGFTGTPIFPENANGDKTTQDVFGNQLHSYIITDAIRDNKVLKFKVDYHATTVKFKDAEMAALGQSGAELARSEKQLLLHQDRIRAVSDHICKVFSKKTHRNMYLTKKEKQKQGFNAMFAVQSIEAAKLYYEALTEQQQTLPEDKRLNIGTIFSYAPNEGQHVIGDIVDESFEANALESTSKQFLTHVIDDYNNMFKTNYTVEGKSFQNYYKDLAKRVKNGEIDLLIVVGMFLTGFDAPSLNTLFVDKNLQYHGLIQAYSRTNRIYNNVKTFGNIVCFRDLEKATIEAIKCFGEENDVNIILEKSYKTYLHGSNDEDENNIVGYETLCKKMIEQFPEPTKIALEADKKEFCKLFGEILKSESKLRNYDEFETFEPIISEALMQDMKSVYVGIKEDLNNNSQRSKEELSVDFSDVEFQVDLLKTDEINLDYILSLIFEKRHESDNEDTFKEEIRRLIQSSIGTRAKEALIMDFINRENFVKLTTKDEVITAFYTYARTKKEQEITRIIENEQLKEGARRYIIKSIEKGFVSSAGMELNDILPPLSRRGGARNQKKDSVHKKIQTIVDVFYNV